MINKTLAFHDWIPEENKDKKDWLSSAWNYLELKEDGENFKLKLKGNGRSTTVNLTKFELKCLTRELVTGTLSIREEYK